MQETKQNFYEKYDCSMDLQLLKLKFRFKLILYLINYNRKTI